MGRRETREVEGDGGTARASETGGGWTSWRDSGDGGAAVPSGFADAVLDLAGFCGRNGTERRSGRDQDCSAC